MPQCLTHLWDSRETNCGGSSTQLVSNIYLSYKNKYTRKHYAERFLSFMVKTRISGVSSISILNEFVAGGFNAGKHIFLRHEYIQYCVCTI